MKNTRILALAMAAALAISGAACSKKAKPAGPGTEGGTTEGTQPSDATRVEPSARTTEPPLVRDETIPVEGPLSNVYFDFDRSDIRADQQPTMDRNASWLQEHAAENVLIEGHCDERGTEEYNLALGDRRANSAKSYLVSLGIRSSRLSTITYGKTRPVDLGHHEGAWSKNRRAEFKVGGATIR